MNVRDMERLTAEIETIFEVYLTQDVAGQLRVNAAEVRRAGASLVQMQQIADGFNARTLPITDTLNSQQKDYVVPLHALGSGAWGKCVLNFVAPGAIDGFAAGVAWCSTPWAS